MLANFISTFICDSILYKILDTEIKSEVKMEIIQLTKKIFENLVLKKDLNHDDFSVYYKYYESLVRAELNNKYNSEKRIALSMVTLAFINYSMANGLGDFQELDTLEFLAYNLLGA